MTLIVENLEIYKKFFFKDIFNSLKCILLLMMDFLIL